MVSKISMRDAGYSVLLGMVGLSVLLQVLVSPISFWTFEGSVDEFFSSFLMGFTVHFSVHHYLPLFSYLSAPLKSTVSYKFLHEHILFRPPLLTEE